MSRSRQHPSLRLMLTVTLGIAAAWGGLVILGIAQWEASTMRRRAGESLAIRIDGEPLISRYRYDGAFAHLPYRTLDGKETSREVQLASSAPFFAKHRQRFWSSGPITWPERLLALNYGGPWYVVRDAAADGKAYLASFDEHSRLPLDYIGRDGFSATAPPPDQQFDVGPAFYYGSDQVVGITLTAAYDANSSFAGDQSISTPSYCVYVLDNDDLVEINVRDRSLRKLATIPGAFSLRMMQMPQAEDDLIEIPPGEQPMLVAGLVSRLVVRADDRLVVVNPKADGQVQLPLPESLRREEFTAYALQDQGFVFAQTTRQSGETTSHLTWVDAAGEVKREDNVVIRVEEESFIFVAFLTAVLTAAPLGFGVLMLVFAPRMTIGTSRGVELLQLFAEIWPIALVLALVALAGAILVYRWHRENDRPHPLRWAVAAFLLGVPGFVAYLILHGRPSIARSRRMPAVAPMLNGNEIFA